MGYIAKTNGGADVLELRVGALADVPAADQGNWRTVVEVGDLAADPFTEVRYISAIAVAEPNVAMTWAKVAAPAPYARMRLKDYAASVRWQKTQRGLTLPSGIALDTSEASKAKIDQALSVLEKGWVGAINWKTKGGWVALDLAAMTAIAQAVVGFEQACFDAEKAVHEAIDAGTITSKAEVDAYAWP